MHNILYCTAICYPVDLQYIFHSILQQRMMLLLLLLLLMMMMMLLMKMMVVVMFLLFTECRILVGKWCIVQRKAFKLKGIFLWKQIQLFKVCQLYLCCLGVGTELFNTKLEELSEITCAHIKYFHRVLSYPFTSNFTQIQKQILSLFAEVWETTQTHDEEFFWIYFKTLCVWSSKLELLYRL